MTKLARVIWLALILIATIVCAKWNVPAPRWPRQQPGGPKLLLLVVFDQMRGDYLQRWYDLYSPDGFRKLTSEGTWFTNCHYPYSMTVTGAGHATLGTGCTPSQHGIIENDWFDRNEGRMVYCASLGMRYATVPPTTRRSLTYVGGGSPERLLVPTVGEVVKSATHQRGKVIGISLKDRGAILPTGRGADICYWFDDNGGNFVTSEYYADRLPRYMTRFNTLKLANRWFDQPWTRFRSDLDYVTYSGPDDVQGEGPGIMQGRTFPHSMNGGDRTTTQRFYDAVYTSPYGNELTWAAARMLIDNEKLGQGDATDYLVISYSSNDAIGHVWGPDSQEVLDVTLRSDLIVAEMIRFLDTKLGRDRYLMVMSADHGICQLPEVARKEGKDAGRINAGQEVADLEKYLSSQYGLHGKWIEAPPGAGIYLRYSTLRNAEKSRMEIENAVAGWLKRRPYVEAVYTRSQLLSGGSLDSIGQAVRASFHPSRSGDVFPVLKPNYFLSKYLFGVMHGSPHDYDTHVPLVVFGAGVNSAKRDELISPQAAAVILADSIGQRLVNSQVKVPDELWETQSNAERESLGRRSVELARQPIEQRR
jgi:hypothetical protein